MTNENGSSLKYHLPKDFIFREHFLGANHFREIQRNVEGTHFAWYLFEDTVYGLENRNDTSRLGFRHAITLADKPNTPHYDLYATIPWAIADAVGYKLHSTPTFHANLTLNHGASEEAANWKLRWIHHDGFLDLETVTLKRYTAILYLDNSDGNTVFFEEDKQTVFFEQSPIPNAILIFPTNTLHSAELPRICNTRRVLNINVLLDLTQPCR
jgi:hypothetical protein